jgi:Phosphopantetheine attachment site
VPEAQRASFLTEFLQREVQEFLRLAQPSAASSRFLDLGTDSLMAVELCNRLYGQVGGVHDQPQRRVRLPDDQVARRVPGRSVAGGLTVGRGRIGRCGRAHLIHSPTIPAASSTHPTPPSKVATSPRRRDRIQSLSAVMNARVLVGATR